MGVYGIWMGGEVRPYYDSVLGHTTGWQTIPLVLIAGGYFMSDVPSGMGFDAASAQKYGWGFWDIRLELHEAIDILVMRTHSVCGTNSGLNHEHHFVYR